MSAAALHHAAAPSSQLPVRAVAVPGAVLDRVPLGQLQPSSLGELLQQDAQMAVSALHLRHEFVRDELEMEQELQRETNIARILAATSFERGVAEGERRAAERAHHE